MKFLDLGFICRVEGDKDLKDYSVGFCDYRSWFLRYKHLTRTKVSLRTFLYSCIGSSKLNYKEKLAIDKLYKEYRDKIDFSKYKDILKEHESTILLGSDITTVLKLMGLFEYMYENLSEIYDDLLTNENYKYLILTIQALSSIEGMDLFVFKYNHWLDGKVLTKFDEYNTLRNKLSISVFKKKRKLTKPFDVYYNALYSMVREEDIEIMGHAISNLLMYSTVSSNIDTKRNHQFYYPHDRGNEETLEKLIKSVKKIDFSITNHKHNLSKDEFENIRMEGWKVFNELNISKENDSKVLAFTNIYLLSTLGFYVPMSKKTLNKVIRLFQQMNNVASVYNVELQFIQDLKDDGLIDDGYTRFLDCLRSSACMYVHEDDIIENTYKLYFSYTLMAYADSTHKERIEKELDHLCATYDDLKDLENLRKEVQDLKGIKERLERENKQLTTRLDKIDNKSVHKYYYNMIKEVTLENEKLQKKIKKDEDKVLTSFVGEELAKNLEDNTPIDLSKYKILFLGHHEAHNTVKQLSKVMQDIIFIDATSNTQVLTKSQLTDVDFICIQYQFIGHDSLRYKEVTDKMGIPVIRIQGTNKDYWVNQLEDAIRMYTK